MRYEDPGMRADLRVVNCKTCVREDWTFNPTIYFCEREKTLDIDLGYPDTHDCTYYCRETGSDDEIGIKLIIAGGREYQLTTDDLTKLDAISISEVVSGCSTGADKAGEKYAEMNDIPVKRFLPDWKKYGKSAGPKRNKQMAQYADAVALFPGGKGTESMYKEAIIEGIEIYDFRVSQ